MSPPLACPDGPFYRVYHSLGFEHGCASPVLYVCPGLEKVSPFLNYGAEDELKTGSLFLLAPQYANSQELVVNFGSHIRLQHVASGCWLHCHSLGGDQTELTLGVRKEPQVEDVYRFESISASYVQDVLYAKNCVDRLITFHAHFETYPKDSPSLDGKSERQQCAGLERVLTDLIMFCSLSNNDNPMTREGIPRHEQQLLLCELLVLERLMSIIEMLLPRAIYLRESIAVLARDGRTDAAITGNERTRTKLVKLCQRVMCLVLRKNEANCKHATAKKDATGQCVFVMALMRQMGYGVLAARTLREVYVDNEALLDSVTDGTVAYMLDLIRSDAPGQGRKARYIDFLKILCECNCKAVRPNQWRIANLLFTEVNQRLLLQLTLHGGEVYIHGDSHLFPTFLDSGGRMELIKWLSAPVPIARCDGSKIPAGGRVTPEGQIIDANGDAVIGNNGSPMIVSDHRVPAGGSIGPTGIILDASGNPVHVDAAGHHEVRRYFEKMIELYQSLVQGRNERNTRLLRDVLPYELVEALITKTEMHVKQHASLIQPFPFMQLCASFVSVCRSLWVDSFTIVNDAVVPHETMTRIKTMRIWDNVEQIYEKGMLSSRTTTTIPIQWDRFNTLLGATFDFLHSHAHHQIATHIPLNRMILELLKLLNDLIRLGFVLSGSRSAEQLASADEEMEVNHATHDHAARKSGVAGTLMEGSKKMITRLSRAVAPATEYSPLSEAEDGGSPTVVQLIPVLLRVLDGQGDRFDEGHQARPEHRYEKEHSELEAMVTGLRYKQVASKTHDTLVIMDCKIWACRILQTVCTMRVDIRLSRLLYLYKTQLARIEQDALSSDVSDHLTLDTIMKVLKIPQIQESKWLYAVLLDCTHYEKPELKEAAMGLLIRQFEQKGALRTSANAVQLLSKKRMAHCYTLFEELLRRLTMYTGRRQLRDKTSDGQVIDEPFKVTLILSQLTRILYVHSSEELASESGASSHMGTNRGSDPMQFMYLQLIGKADVNLKSSSITCRFSMRLAPSDSGVLSELDDELVAGDQVQLEGAMYTVKRVSGLTAVLDRAFEWPAMPPELALQSNAVIWLLVLRRIKKPDRDMQLMMLNIQGGALIHHAIKLLDLPFDVKIRHEDLSTRAVVRAVYRLLKAFCASFPSGQSMLAPSLSKFLPHCEADLVSSDISPMGCINTIFKDNYSNCAGVTIEHINRVLQLCAETKAPRMIRFLSNLIEPMRKVIVSNQTLVARALSTKKSALQLYADADGLLERDHLIKQNDHVDHPRGELMYHIETIRLLANMTKGNASDGPHAENQRWLQTHLSLDQLTECLRAAELPYVLQTAYIDLLRCGYITCKRLAGASEFIDIESTLHEMLSALMNACSHTDYRSSASVPTRSSAAKPRKSRTGSFFAGADAQAHAREAECVLFDALLPALTDLYKYNPALVTQMQPVDGEQLSSGILSSVLPRIIHHIHAKGVHTYKSALHDLLGVLRLHELLNILHGGTAKSHLFQTLAEALKGSNITSDVSATTGPDQQLGSAVMRAAGDDADDGLVECSDGIWRHPQESWSYFVDEMIAPTDVLKEADPLISIFMEDLDAVIKSRKMSINEHQRMSHTQQLVQQLASLRSWTNGHLTKHQLQQACTCLQVLAKLVKAQPETAKHKQQRYDGRLKRRALTAMGAPAVALSMAACTKPGTEQLCQAGLQLMCALLGEGDQEVQYSMHELLSNTAHRDLVKPADGSDKSFFESMRMRLQRGGDEVDARKLYEDRKKSLLATIEEDTRDLGTVAKTRYVEYVKRPFASNAAVFDVLSALRLLCEGHNSRLQDYLRVQPSEPMNVDLISEVYRLFESLAQHPDDSDIAQLSLCVATLTELVQGNESGGTVDVLIDTKLIGQLSRLITPIATEGLHRLHAAELQCEVSTLLLSLIESERSTLVQERMLRSLDLDDLARLVQATHQHGWQRMRDHVRAGNEAVSEREQTATRQAASNAYIITRYLIDFELADASTATHDTNYAPRSRALQALGTKVSEDLRKYHARHTGSIEICNARGVMNRVLFPISHPCLMLLNGNESALPSAENVKNERERVIWGFQTPGKEKTLDQSSIKDEIGRVRSIKPMMHESKEELLWSIDRTKRATQIRDFVQGVRLLHFEMNHLASLQENKVWILFSEHKEFFFDSTFKLAILQNVVLLERYSRSEELVELSSIEKWANVAMGVLQVLFCLASLINVSVQLVPLRLMRENLWPFDDRYSLHTTSRWKQDDLSALDLAWLLLASVGCVLYNMRFTSTLLLFFAALLGLFKSPLWFAVHLLDVINMSSDLQYVFKSVTTHGSAILMTTVFGIFIIYIYAAAGHGMLPPHAFAGTRTNLAYPPRVMNTTSYTRATNATGWTNATSDGERPTLFQLRNIVTDVDALTETDDIEAIGGDLGAERGHDTLISSQGGVISTRHGRMLASDPRVYCDNLFYCWVAAVNEGLRSGDIGALMPPPDPSDSMVQYLGVVLYQFTFWCIVITILLSLIFGIIIDTFSHLRTEHREKEMHMDGTCFICGVDRLTLDTQGNGFEAHIREEHNMWQYAFAIIHVRGKDPLHYSGWEAFVASRLDEDDFSFMPSNNAISLHQFHARRVREANRLSNQVSTIEASLASTMKQVDMIAEQSNQIVKLLSTSSGRQQLRSSITPIDEQRASTASVEASVSVRS